MIQWQHESLKNVQNNFKKSKFFGAQCDAACCRSMRSEKLARALFVVSENTELSLSSRRCCC